MSESSLVWKPGDRVWEVRCLRVRDSSVLRVLYFRNQEEADAFIYERQRVISENDCDEFRWRCLSGDVLGVDVLSGEPQIIRRDECWVV